MISSRKELTGVPLEKLIPYPDNPRVNEDGVEKVKASLLEFGYAKVSIGIDEEYVLLYGHTTLKAFQELAEEDKKWKKVPVVSQLFGLTEPQKLAYRVADNRLQEYSFWDSEKLVAELLKMEKEGYDIANTGFTEFDKQDMLNELQKGDAEVDKMFKEFKKDVTTDHKCPKCGFEWNG